MNRARHAMAGLTLLEVLIGVTILAVITAALGQMSWLMTKGRQRIERRDLRYHAARVVLERIARDVGMAYLVETPSLKGNAGGAPVVQTAFRGTDRGDEDTLDFTTLAGHRYVANRPESDQRKVGYALVPAPDAAGGKQLVRREAHWVEGDVREEGEVIPLLEGVRAFQLEYYDGAKGEWDAEWDSTERAHQGKLPAAVRITLKVSDPNDPARELPFTTIVRVGLAPGPVEF